MKVCFAKIREAATIPQKREEDAGFDLFACFDEQYLKFEPFEIKLVPTGLACALEEDAYLQIEERSSTGKIGLKKNAGIIDSGYRGEIIIELQNANPLPLFISKLSEDEISQSETGEFVFHSYSKAVAQGILHKIYPTEVEILSYDKLKSLPSLRGTQGFGSTDK